MSEITIERQNLIQAINTLPDEALIELSSFVQYLCYKTLQPSIAESPKQNFLLMIAGLGQSGQSHISDSDDHPVLPVKILMYGE